VDYLMRRQKVVARLAKHGHDGAMTGSMEGALAVES